MPTARNCGSLANILGQSRRRAALPLVVCGDTSIGSVAMIDLPWRDFLSVAGLPRSSQCGRARRAMETTPIRPLASSTAPRARRTDADGIRTQHSRKGGCGASVRTMNWRTPPWPVCRALAGVAASSLSLCLCRRAFFGRSLLSRVRAIRKEPPRKARCESPARLASADPSRRRSADSASVRPFRARTSTPRRAHLPESRSRRHRRNVEGCWRPVARAGGAAACARDRSGPKKLVSITVPGPRVRHLPTAPPAIPALFPERSRRARREPRVPLLARAGSMSARVSRRGTYCVGATRARALRSSRLRGLAQRCRPPRRRGESRHAASFPPTPLETPVMRPMRAGVVFVMS